MLALIDKIKERTQDIFKDLELPLIKIKFENSEGSCFNSACGIIIIGLNKEKTIFFEQIYPYLKYRPKIETDKTITLWNFFHELAHHIQYSKHQKWYNYYRRIKKHLFSSSSSINDKAYRKFKIEANADKIAYILFNKYKKDFNL